MKQMLKRFFTTAAKCWWVFPIFCLAYALIIILAGALHCPYNLFGALFNYLGMACCAVVIIAWIGAMCIQIRAKKWRHFLLNLILTVLSLIISVTSLVVAGFVFLFNPNEQPDPFGKEHPIPADLVCNYVLNDTITPAVNPQDRDSYLQIYHDIQGGMYLYDLHYPALTEGAIFLRCYEATQDIPLSESRLKKASTVSIPATQAFSQVVNRQAFTIYEGDWGDFYAVRVEVWHKDRQTGKETKLLEKLYAMDGWQR